MAAANKLQNLVIVKQALADKYIRLAKVAGSKPKRTHLLYRAQCYNRQVVTLKRLVEAA